MLNISLLSRDNRKGKKFAKSMVFILDGCSFSFLFFGGGGGAGGSHYIPDFVLPKICCRYR